MYPWLVDSSDSGQDSGHLVNPFMRVTQLHDEAFGHLKRVTVTSAVSRACVNFITLTFRAPDRNHTVSALFEAIAMFCFSMNSGIAPVRSNSELIVPTQGLDDLSLWHDELA